MGKRSSRGGLIDRDGVLENRRVLEELERFRKYIAAQRERGKKSAAVRLGSEPATEKKTPAKKKTKAVQEADAPLPSWSAQAGDDWKAGTGGLMDYKRIGKALKPMVDHVAAVQQIDNNAAWQRIRPFWQKFCASPGATYGPESFVKNPRQVIQHKGGPTVGERAMAAVQEAEGRQR
jgi:hypothetical protein